MENLINKSESILTQAKDYYKNALEKISELHANLHVFIDKLEAHTERELARIGGEGNSSGRKKRDLSDDVNRAYNRANRLYESFKEIEKSVEERSKTLETKLRRRKELTITIQVRIWNLFQISKPINIRWIRSSSQPH